MTAIILTCLALYALLVAAIGIWASVRGHDTAEDYFVHSRSLSWFHLGVTLFATWYSTIAFIAFPGKLITGGISVYLALGTFNIMTALFLWFIGRKFWLMGRARGYITPGDLLGDYYKSRSIRLLTGLIAAVGLFPYVLVQLVGIGKVIDVATAGTVSYEAAVVISAAVAAFYVVSGGIRAIVWTDIVQAALFLAVAGLGLYAVLSVVGDIRSGFQNAVQRRPDLFTFRPEAFGASVTLLVTWSFGGVLLPHLWQRAYMARSGETITKTVIFHAGFTFVYLLILAVMTLLAIGFFAELPDSDKFVPALFAQVIPWALPVLVLATFAAGMSTLDSQLLTFSSVLIRDVYGALRPGAALSPSREKLIARIVILVAILALTASALTPGGQGPMLAMASKGVGLAFMLLVPVVGPLFWPRAGRAAALWALIAGVAVQAGFELGALDIEIPYGFGSPIIAFLCQVPVFITLALASSGPRKILPHGQ